jgi:RNA polymerase sigma factor (sigma-70 family)
MPNPELLGPARAVTQLFNRAASTEDLLRRYALDRDADAFAALVERFRTLVLRRCRAVLGRDDLASDAAQETFIALARHASRLEGAGTLVRWLEKVARNKAKDIRRRERRLRRLTATIAPLAVTAGDRTGEELQRAELREQVSRALAQLPREQRRAVELCYLDGLTQREVASILNAPASTIAWRVQDGLERLKGILSRRGLAPAALATLPGLFAQFAQQAEAAAPVAQAWAQAALAVARAPAKTGFAWLGWLGSKKVAAALLVVLVVAVLALTHWSMSRPEEKSTEQESHALAPEIARADEPESLQQRNLRLLRAEVEPKIVEALRSLIKGKGEVSIVSRAANGHHVICSAEVRNFIDQPDRTYVSRHRFVYDMLSDGFTLFSDPHGNGEFRSIDPNRPIILSRNPNTGKEIVVKIPALEEIERAFQLISPDIRAVAECTQAWEQQPKAGVGPFIPGPIESWAGNSKQLFVKVRNWLWAARLGSPDLQWRCLGPCHGKHLAANEESLFIVHDEQLLMRPAEGEVLRWKPLCRSEDEIVKLAATRDFVFCVRSNTEVRAHAVGDTNYAWPYVGQANPTAWFGSADVLYCVQGDALLSRPATMSEETPFTLVEQPVPGTVTLAGNRLWEIVRQSETANIWRSRAWGEPGSSWRFEGTVIQLESWRPETILRFDERNP